MCTLRIASDVPKDAHVFESEATVPQPWASRLFARLRASVASVSGLYPCRGTLRSTHTPLEMDPIARLARDYPLSFTYWSLPF
jgi:hypothetical protein